MADTKRLNRSIVSPREQISKAVMEKLIPSNYNNVNETGKANTASVPSKLELMPFVRDGMRNNLDAENTFDVLPDMQFVADIVVSSILASKDLVTANVVIESEAEYIPSDLKAEMVKIVFDYFDKRHPLKTYLYDILIDTLYKTGSYAVAIIPETSVDKIINEVAVGNESYERGLQRISAAIKNSAKNGYIGDPNVSKPTANIGLEYYLNQADVVPAESKYTFTIGENGTAGSYIITDDPMAIVLPRLNEIKARSVRSGSAYKAGLESADLNITRLDKSVYKNRSYNHKVIEEIDAAENADRLTVGHPLVQHFPSASVIRVTIPGDVKRDIGALVVLDEFGYPVSEQSLISNPNTAWIFKEADSANLANAALTLGITQGDKDTWTYQRLISSYTELVEAKLITALKNGRYGDNIGIVKPDEVYRIMMARALSKKSTQILYVPAEQFVYFALDYDKHGIGRSLLERNKLLSTIRTAMMVATMQSAVMNAAREVDFNIELDPNDREPDKTIEDTRQKVIEQFAADIPYSGTPDDMMSYIARAGVVFSITGNEHYPSTKISRQTSRADYQLPDTDIVEMFAKQHYRGLLADPDVIMNPESIEFATQIVSKNILNAKRIALTQERISPHITHYVKTYLISDGLLLKELADKVRAYYDISTERELRAENDEGKKENTDATTEGNNDNLDTRKVEVSEEQLKKRKRVNKIVGVFIESLNASLPAPDWSMLNSQMEAFNDRAEALDKMLPHIVTDSMLIGTKYEQNADMLREIIKSYILRNWLRSNDVDKDLQAIVNADNIADTVQMIVADELHYAEAALRIATRLEKRRETLSKNLNVTDSSGNNGGFAQDSSSEEDSDDFGGGGFDDDMDFSDEDTGDEDDSVEDETGTEEETEESADDQDTTDDENDDDSKTLI